MKKTKYGIVVGKFYPLHLGHVNMIQKASSMCEKLIVVLSVSKAKDKALFIDSNMKVPLSDKDRLRILKQTFYMQDTITCIKVDESDIAPYPNGWKNWAALVNEAVHKVEPSLKWMDVTFFSSEPQDEKGYKENFRTNFWGDAFLGQEIDETPCEFQLMDSERGEIDISATKVRHDPYTNWNLLPRATKEALCPTIVIAGGESSGKTTLVDKLANYYATTSAWEFGREYVEDVLKGDEMALQYSDYDKIPHGHYENVQRAKRNANGIAFSDTDYVATQAFCITYEGKPHPTVEFYINNYPSNLVILLDNSTKWIDDGMRTLSDAEKRNKFQLLLKQLYKEHGIPYVEIKSSDYLTRYELCKDIVKKFLDGITLEEIQEYIIEVENGIKIKKEETKERMTRMIAEQKEEQKLKKNNEMIVLEYKALQNFNSEGRQFLENEIYKAEYYQDERDSVLLISETGTFYLDSKNFFSTMENWKSAGVITQVK